MGAPPNEVFSAFAFIGFVMCSIPFYWHLEVWHNNAINWAPVWCDISARIIIASSVAIPAASLCINRRLYKIASIKTVTITRSEKRRGVMVDLAIGLGIPVLEMILQYVVQGHRFDILEDYGCFPATYNTPPAYALVFCWPLAIGAVSFVYCSLTIRHFWKRRQQFNDVLSSSRNLNQSRYFRLMALAGIELLGTIPISSYSIYLNVTTNQVQRWISWEDTHSNFSRVRQIPAVLWRLSHQEMVSVELSRWLLVLCAFIFFTFFGFADEARKHYRLAYTSVASRLGHSTASMSSTESSGFETSKYRNGSSSRGRVTLPAFTSSTLSRSKRDSLLSFSDKLSTSISIGEFGVVEEKGKPYSPTESTASSSFDYIEQLGRRSSASAPEHAITHPVQSLDIVAVPRPAQNPPAPSSKHSGDMV
ncbi:hypothetical protein EW146_g4686 [Bondarzewia mesenterica]|uniref:G-protein coupled receptors family 1 profile domain-containing protein n=1 Tax=Bondarzewia mesenterica TaxID=1095465 RepID=A0A4S4LVN0_9AGAM|nr:hypothetical protein EW146_g4686 [Bondarzewia mesenterica]